MARGVREPLMFSRLAADAVLLTHLGFIVFALLGGLLGLRWRWAPLVHLPAVAWAAYVELAGRMCPLTGLENALRRAAGDSGYSESFVEHYLLGVIYPDGLTRQIELGLGIFVLVLNVAIYALLIQRWRARHHTTV